MTIKNYIYILVLYSIIVITRQENGVLLKGKIISSDTNSESVKNAFDGDLNTVFKSSKESFGWIGLDLSKEYNITKIGWAQPDDNKFNYLLGVFEGANKEDFFDALPLIMITEQEEANKMIYYEINVTKAFRYIRYIGPNEKFCIISNIEVYGYISNKIDNYFYQPTNLPLIVVHILDNVEPKDKGTDYQCNMVILDKNKIHLEANASIKLRGNSSMRFPKKPYKIKFSTSVNPLYFNSKSKKWILLANYTDKSLLRTLLAFEISRLFNMKYTVTCEPVDLMINGELKGNFNLCEELEVSQDRIQLDEMDYNSIREPEITGGYRIEIDGFAYQEKAMFNSNHGIPVTIKYPDEDKLLVIQYNYIKNKFNELEEEIYKLNFSKIDSNTFSSYFLISELTGNSDAYWSIYLYKERNDEKFYFGPVWDFDVAFDNDIRVYPINKKEDFLLKYCIYAGTVEKIIKKIINNYDFRLFIFNKWTKLIFNDILSKTKITDFIKQKAELINSSQKLNFIRWDILNEKVYFNPVILGTFEGEINYLTKFINNRIDWLTSFICYGNLTINKSEDFTNSKVDYGIDYSDNKENDFDFEFLGVSRSFLKKYNIILYLFFYFFLLATLELI